MARKSVFVMAIAGMVMSSGAFALGLGNIKPESALDQPLSARIPLFSASQDDLQGMSVSLAPASAFNRVGVDRPFYLSRLRFQVVHPKNGPAYIKVTTREPVKEPFLDFLVRVDWPRGQMVREYTVLLDPPVYAAKQHAVQVSAASTGGHAAAVKPAATPAKAPAVAEASAAATANVRKSSAGSPSGQAHEYGPVQSTDTLWHIAEKTRPDHSVTIKQTMWAIFQANRGAFIDGNINVLMKGKVLRIPGKSQIQQVSRADAAREVHKQIELWRQEHASASAEAATSTGANKPAAKSAGKAQHAETAVKQAPAKSKSTGNESRLEVVAPPKAGAGGNETGLLDNNLPANSKNVQRLQQALSLSREDAASLKAENQDLQSQVAALKKRYKALQSAININSPAAGAAKPETQGQTAETPKPQSSVSQAPASAQTKATPAEPVGAATAEKTAQPSEATPQRAATPAHTEAKPEANNGAKNLAEPAAQPKPPAKPKPAAKTKPPVKATPPAARPETFSVQALMAFVEDNPVLAGSAAGGVILLLLLLWLSRRHRGTDDSDYPPETTPHYEVTTEVGGAAVALGDGDRVRIEPEMGASGDEEAVEPAAVAQADVEPEDSGDEEADALSEAEVYLAYGRYDQAKDVLEQALEGTPERTDLRLKLMEVHALNHDREAFEKQAEILYGQVPDANDPTWQRAMDMGREIAPENPLFGGTGRGDAATAVADSDDAAASGDVIENLEFAASDAASGPTAGSTGNDVPLDFGWQPESAEDADREPESAAPEEGEVVDFAAFAERGNDQESKSSVVADEPGESDDLNFDFPSVDDEPHEAAQGSEGQDLDFALNEDGASGSPSGEVDPVTVSEVPGDEVTTKLDLAQAYMDMGDSEGARDLLNEVIEEGDSDQQTTAKDLLSKIA